MPKFAIAWILACLCWPALGAEPTANTPDPLRVSAAQLKRIHSAAPKYPRSASNDRIEGRVVLNFTVMPDGTTADVEVAQSDPAGVFDDNAVLALQQWRFQPVMRNDKPVPQPAWITVEFKMQPMREPLRELEPQ